ncbi:hypothetical protein BKA00_002899 [Actinomadura coerulea]|uniref:Uncharacterized protein n=1 Tax=Actinomadura coerulea TaxID=46159 RepID=A0A7X0KZ17_9ACTN|nr:hypothetical protein [Actinomadura coerulea]MBB6395985.1 hypothetical protein [Actinomadura coerulea]GGQ30808.1 hypothetical protein GCM10010187_54610 [Actinomadura coerulea]
MHHRDGGVEDQADETAERERDQSAAETAKECEAGDQVGDLNPVGDHSVRV